VSVWIAVTALIGATTMALTWIWWPSHSRNAAQQSGKQKFRWYVPVDNCRFAYMQTGFC